MTVLSVLPAMSEIVFIHSALLKFICCQDAQIWEINLMAESNSEITTITRNIKSWLLISLVHVNIEHVNIK